MATLKIAICVPCYGDPKGLFVQSLANMLSYFHRARLESPDGEPYDKIVETFIVGSSMLTEVRHKLVAEALNWGADYMLCLDADHTFAEDTLDRLLMHNAMVVGCNYVRRSLPTAPTAASIEKDDDSVKWLVYTTPEKVAAGLVEPVSHIGMGCVLINMKLFDVLQLHAESKGEKSFLPLFKFEPTTDGAGMRGEDVYFFDKVRAAGVTVFCDHAVSWMIGHCHEILMTHQHALDQRSAWGDDRKQRATQYLDPPNARVEGAAA